MHGSRSTPRRWRGAVDALLGAPRRPAPALRPRRRRSWQPSRRPSRRGAVPAARRSTCRRLAGGGRSGGPGGGAAAGCRPASTSRRARCCARRPVRPGRRAAPTACSLVVHHLVGRRRLLAHPAGGPARPPTRSCQRGEPVALPPKTTSFKRWAERARRARRSASELARRSPYWLADGRRGRRRCRSTSTGGGHRVAARPAMATVRLDEEETGRCCRRCRAVYRTQINDVLLAALRPRLRAAGRARRACASTWRATAARSSSTDVDLSRTVGWFTTLFPVLARARRRRSGPGRGAQGGQGAAARGPRPRPRLRPAALPARRTPRLCERAAPRCRRAEVGFNYLGQLDQAPAGGGSRFAPARGGERARRRAREQRARATCSRSPPASPDGRLQLQLDLQRGRAIAQATIERLAARFRAALARAHRALPRRPRRGGYTPSDFPLAGLDQAGPRPALARAPGGIRADRGHLPAVAAAAGDALPHASYARRRGSTSSSSADAPRRRSTSPPSARLAAGASTATRSCAPPSSGRTSTPAAGGARARCALPVELSTTGASATPRSSARRSATSSTGDRGRGFDLARRR